MKKTFSMSMFANKEDLYKAKAEYFEAKYNEAKIALGCVIDELEDCAQPSDWDSYNKAKELLNT